MSEQSTKRCPFCGGVGVEIAEPVAKDTIFSFPMAHFVRCRDCGARTSIEAAPEPARIAWNMRVSE